MEKIAVLIPCYNEEKTIKKVVEDWKKELPEATIYVYRYFWPHPDSAPENTSAVP